MIVVRPVGVEESALVSNIPEPDTAQGEVEWDDSATYDVGDEVIKVSTHRKYRSATDGNTSDPEAGVLADPPTWVDVGATNRYAMFDGFVGTQSLRDDLIEVEFTPMQLTNGMAVFNLLAISATVEVTDPTEGVVYSRSVDLRDESGIVDYYEYFFLPIIQRTEFVLLDLPAYNQATIKVSLERPGGEVRLGEMVFGRQIQLGVAEYGTSLQMLDFSVRERDEFGNFIVNRRRTSKLVDFDGFIGTGRVGYVFQQLDRLSTIPALWVADEEREDDPTLVYGYYKDMTINISNPQTSNITIQIEGLV